MRAGNLGLDAEQPAEPAPRGGHSPKRLSAPSGQVTACDKAEIGVEVIQEVAERGRIGVPPATAKAKPVLAGLKHGSWPRITARTSTNGVAPKAADPSIAVG